jgi:hypothetical protein
MIMNKDKLIKDKDAIEDKGGLSIYIEFKDAKYQVIGVHNGFSPFGDEGEEE